jgi:ATP-dependent DNA helicase PIF1
MVFRNIGGCTLHSWSGIGLGVQPQEKLYESIMRFQPSRERWRSTGVLIVDESRWPRAAHP